MAKFYGTVDGCASTLGTRRGTESSGIKASVQSYEGSVITRLEVVDGQNILSIDTAKDSRSNFGDRQFRGTIEEFNEAMQLIKDIKNGKVSITRHRDESNKMKQLKRMFED